MNPRTLPLLLALAALACGQTARDAAPVTPPAPSAPSDSPRERACPGISALPINSERPCTEIGCKDGYFIKVERASTWALGEYTYELTLDGRTVSCEGALPLKPCGEPSLRCSSPSVSISEVGCALPPAQQYFGDLEIDSLPSELKLTIKHNGAVLLSQALEAAYKTAQPNGEGCGPVCCQASASVSIP